MASKSLSPTAQTALIVTGTIATGGLVWWLATRDKATAEKKDQFDSQKAAEKTLQTTQAAGGPQAKLTKSEASYNRIADQIQQALTGFFTDNKDRAESLLKEINTDADFEKVNIVYGVRYLEDAWGRKQGPFNLAQTVTKELYSNQIQRINALYRQRGINRRW